MTAGWWLVVVVALLALGAIVILVMVGSAEVCDDKTEWKEWPK